MSPLWKLRMILSRILKPAEPFRGRSFYGSQPSWPLRWLPSRWRRLPFLFWWRCRRIPCRGPSPPCGGPFRDGFSIRYGRPVHGDSIGSGCNSETGDHFHCICRARRAHCPGVFLAFRKAKSHLCRGIGNGRLRRLHEKKGHCHRVGHLWL